MERGPRNETEWQKYSSYNIGELKKLPMSELVATQQILQVIYSEGIEAREEGEIPDEQLDEEKLYLEITEKRINIVGVAIFKKIETLFKIPKFK